MLHDNGSSEVAQAVIENSRAEFGHEDISEPEPELGEEPKHAAESNDQEPPEAAGTMLDLAG